MKQRTTFFKSVLAMTALILAGSNLHAQTPIAHYGFNGNLNDATTNWNLSASSGFTPTYETGKDGTANGAISDFGTNDYLETSADFTPLTGSNGTLSRSMSAWVKLSSTGQRAIVGLGFASNLERWTFGFNGANARLEIQSRGFNGTTAVEVDTWTHLACVYDNTSGSETGYIYINGVAAGSQDWSGHIPATAASVLRVGNDFNADPAVRGFTGAIDDLRIYDQVLNATQIAAIYSAALLSNGESKSLETFNAYPNPVKDRLYFSTNKIASVEIYNLLGSKISSQKVENGVDMSTLSKGVYLVKCQDNEGVSIATIKAIKE